MTTVGELRHRITFQTLTRTPDEIGGAASTWVDFITVWAQIKPVSGGERYFAQKIEDTYDHRIRIRTRTDLNTTMQIKFKNRIFQVKAIMADLERKDFSWVYAMENVGT